MPPLGIGYCQGQSCQDCRENLKISTFFLLIQITQGTYRIMSRVCCAEDILKQVTSLFDTIMRMGNPFLDIFPELVSLTNRNCVDESVAIVLHSLEDIGCKQYQDFVTNVLLIHHPIKKNSLALFKRPQPKAVSKKGKRI